MQSIYTHRRARTVLALTLAAPLALRATAARAQSALDQPPAAANAATAATSAEPATSSAPAPEASPHATVRIAAGRGLTVESADHRVSLTVRGFVQGRVTVDVPTPAMAGADVVPTTLFSARRARVILAGTLLGPTLSYQVHFGLAPQDFAAAAPLFDAFVTWAPIRDLSVRVGQFFVPFNRNRWISIARQMMLERPIATNEFNLDRDIGLMMFSNDLGGVGGRLNYALGVFSGAGRNRLEADYGLLYVARFGVNPLGRFDDHDAEWDLVRSGPRLALGVAGAFNHRASTYATVGLGAMPDTNKYDRAHLTGDLLFKARGFALQLEGLARWSLTATGLASATRPGWGYTVQASYLTAIKLGVGARWSQVFAMPAAMDTTAFRESFELGGIIAYHALDGALTVGVDYTLRDENVAYPRHEVRAQVQAMF
jgi:hypothetical protein